MTVTNEAYLICGTRQRINLLGAVQVDYREGATHGPTGLWNHAEDLASLVDGWDGYMDEGRSSP